MNDLPPELLKILVGSGPLGVAVYFLGKKLLDAWTEDRKAWAEDRAEIKRIAAANAGIATTNAEIASKAAAALDANTLALHRVANRLGEPPGGKP